MSEENVEIVLRMLRAWANGEREAARGAFDPHVVCLLPAFDITVSYGIPAMERAVEAWRSSWDDWHTELEEAIDAGDHVVVINRQRGTGKESRAEVAFVTNGVFSLRKLEDHPG